jgi:hypothetical protein
VELLRARRLEESSELIKRGPLVWVVHGSSLVVGDFQSVDAERGRARSDWSLTHVCKMYANCAPRAVTERDAMDGQDRKPAARRVTGGRGVTTENGRFLTGGQEVPSSNLGSPTTNVLVGDSRSENESQGTGLL